MNDPLTISNIYAAYTTLSNKSDKNVSELSKMIKGESLSKDPQAENDPSLSMDTVIISKEALERLSGMSLAAERDGEK